MSNLNDSENNRDSINNPADPVGQAPVNTAAQPQDAEFTEKAQAASQAGYQQTGSTGPQPVYSKPKKEHRRHPVLYVVLCAAVSTACGLGGGYLAYRSFGTKSTIIYQSTAAAAGSSTASATTAAVTSNGSAALSIQEVAAKAQPSVVEILVTESGTSMFGQSYSGEAAGSGVIISSDGYIITNNHVIENASSIQVTTYDGTNYTATLVGTDSKSDIAVLKINATGLSAATIGDSSTLKVGDTAVVIGNPLGTLGGTVTDGIISATDREVTIDNESMNLIQTNAAINSGNSGGGLFDTYGNLVGIVNAKDSGTTSSGATIEGLGFAIPINDAMDVAQQLITSGTVTDRATLGVYLQDVTQDTGNYKAGVYVTSVIQGSGAEKAGLQAYDRIIAVDGTEISTYTELSKIIKNHSVGDTVTLTIVRSSKQMDVSVTLTGPLTESKQG